MPHSESRLRGRAPGLLGSVPGSVPGLRSALGQNLTSNPFKSFVSPCCLNSGEKPWVTPLDPVQSTGMVGDGYNSLPRNHGDLSLGRTSTFLRDHSVIRTNPEGTETFLHLQKPRCSFNVTFKINITQHFIVLYSFHIKITLVGLQTSERENNTTSIFIPSSQRKRQTSGGKEVWPRAQSQWVRSWDPVLFFSSSVLFYFAWLLTNNPTFGPRLRDLTKGNRPKSFTRLCSAFSVQERVKGQISLRPPVSMSLARACPTQRWQRGPGSPTTGSSRDREETQQHNFSVLLHLEHDSFFSSSGWLPLTSQASSQTSLP